MYTHVKCMLPIYRVGYRAYIHVFIQFRGTYVPPYILAAAVVCGCDCRRRRRRRVFVNTRRAKRVYWNLVREQISRWNAHNHTPHPHPHISAHPQCEKCFHGYTLAGKLLNAWTIETHTAARQPGAMLSRDNDKVFGGIHTVANYIFVVWNRPCSLLASVFYGEWYMYYAMQHAVIQIGSRCIGICILHIFYVRC